MPQSLARVLVHIIFSTKNREPVMTSAELREAMNVYLVGILKKQNCAALAVNSAEDHVHLLCALSRTLSLADLLEELKKSSSRWAKSNIPGWRAWQAGYGVFSVSESNVGAVKSYIAKQERHHRRISFQDEFRQFLERHKVSYDENYVWD